jgi:DNA-directed RNA polymerase specialized sigma24 family protein
VRIKWRRSNEDAKDLVQGFFTTLIERDILANFDPSKARFRTYLQICLDRFVMKQDESANRLKRGGDQCFTFDFDEAEFELAALRSGVMADSAEEIFLREWQREIFALALHDLETFCREAGKNLHYRVFKQYDLAQGERPSYAEIAVDNDLTVATVTNYLAWSRRELRRFVGQHITLLPRTVRSLLMRAGCCGGDEMHFPSDRVLDHLRRVAQLPDLSGTRYELGEELGRGGMG